MKPQMYGPQTSRMYMAHLSGEQFGMHPANQTHLNTAQEIEDQSPEVATAMADTSWRASKRGNAKGSPEWGKPDETRPYLPFSPSKREQN